MSLIPNIFGGRRTIVFNPFSIDLRDPFDGFFSSAVTSNMPALARETSQFANARIDWKATPEAHIFQADLPGLKNKKGKTKVEVEEGRILQISGERSKKQEEKNEKWHRIRRSSGKFFRRFKLSDNAKMDQVKLAWKIVS